MAASKIKLNLNNILLPDLIDKMDDVSDIEDVIKLKITEEYILMYSILSNDGGAVLALKSYILPTNEYITKYESENTFDFIITDAKKVVKSLKFFTPLNPTTLELTYSKVSGSEDVMHVRASQFNNGKLKIPCIGGDMDKIRDLNKSTLESYLDPKKSKWGFSILKSDFADVKKLCSIHSQDKTVTVTNTNGKVSISQLSKWDMDIDEIEHKNATLTFNRQYLGNINTEINDDRIRFSVFDTFMLVKDDISNLMLSFEATFDDD